MICRGKHDDYEVRKCDSCCPHSDISICSGSFAGAIHQFIQTECYLNQFEDSLEQIRSLSLLGMQQTSLANLKLSIFASNGELLKEVMAIVDRQSWLVPAAVELIIQKPASGMPVGIQAWQTSDVWTHPHTNDRAAKVISNSRVSWTFQSINSPYDENINLESWFSRSWNRTSDEFAAREFDLTHVVRTWLYIGDICGHSEGEENYQRINRARSELFSKYADQFARGNFSYPASTGIGQKKGSFSMGTLGCKTSPSVRVISVENKSQTSAFFYPKSESKFPPLFSRAVAIIDHSEVFVLLSGTASIVGSRSVHLDDVEKQTQQAIDNIEGLLEEAAPELVVGGSRLQTLKSCVVYIKHAEHYDVVKSICERRLPAQAAITYSISDICRPELLIEIEGIAILSDGMTSKAGNP